MLRRHFLHSAAFAFPLLLPAAEREIRDVLAALAAALAAHDTTEFLRYIDDRMPSFAVLRSNVEALAEQAEVISSIDLLQITETGSEASAQADWVMTVKSRIDGGPTERRRRILTFRFRRQNRDWKVTDVDPVAFFEAPRWE